MIAPITIQFNDYYIYIYNIMVYVYILYIHTGILLLLLLLLSYWWGWIETTKQTSYCIMRMSSWEIRPWWKPLKFTQPAVLLCPFWTCFVLESLAHLGQSVKLVATCWIFHGKIHYKWWFSIIMLNYQRANPISEVFRTSIFMFKFHVHVWWDYSNNTIDIFILQVSGWILAVTMIPLDALDWWSILPETPYIFFWQKPWCVQWRFSPKSKPIHWEKCITPDLAFHLSTVCAIALPGFASQYPHRCHDKSALSPGEWKLKTSLLLGPGWVNWYPKTVVFVLEMMLSHQMFRQTQVFVEFLDIKGKGRYSTFPLVVLEVHPMCFPIGHG